jgi:hypothetical protein
MGELELDQVVSKGEDEQAPTQSDSVGNPTRPSVLRKVHRCVSVRAHVLIDETTIS